MWKIGSLVGCLTGCLIFEEKIRKFNRMLKMKFLIGSLKRRLIRYLIGSLRKIGSLIGCLTGS